MHFVREPLVGRVIFGAGAFASLPDVVAQAGLRRVALVGSASAAAKVHGAAEMLGGVAGEVEIGARGHVPAGDVDALAERVADAHDGIVAVGGGSAIGLAKAVAVDRRLSVVAVPTTYSGSEMTAVYGISSNGAKRTTADPAAAPRAVVYDPELTLDLPASVSVPTGINAVAHCVEALYAPDADPTMRLIARNGLRLLLTTLRHVTADPHDITVRTEMLVGAYQAGTALATCGMGVHHRICHVLGGSTMAPHGQLNAVVLPHVVALNAPGAAALRDALGEVVGHDDVAGGLWELFRGLGAPTSLPDAGAGQVDLDKAAANAFQRSRGNPVPLSESVVRELLERVHRGLPPAGLVGSRVEEDG